MFMHTYCALCDTFSDSILNQSHDVVSYFIKGLLEEPVDEFDSEATIKAKDFYVSCMNLSKPSKIHMLSLVAFALVNEMIGEYETISVFSPSYYSVHTVGVQVC